MAESLPPQIIQGYGDGLFRIAGVEHRGSVIVFTDRTVPWAGEVSEAGLAAVLAAEAALDLLLVGCGATMRPVPAVKMSEQRPGPDQQGVACSRSIRAGG